MLNICVTQNKENQIACMHGEMSGWEGQQTMLRLVCGEALLKSNSTQQQQGSRWARLQQLAAILHCVHSGFKAQVLTDELNKCISKWKHPVVFQLAKHCILWCILTFYATISFLKPERILHSGKQSNHIGWCCVDLKKKMIKKYIAYIYSNSATIVVNDQTKRILLFFVSILWRQVDGGGCCVLESREHLERHMLHCCVVLHANFQQRDQHLRVSLNIGH